MTKRLQLLDHRRVEPSTMHIPQRVCGPGDVVVIPGGAEHEGWFREDSEVIDFFAPRRDDFLLGGKPAYIGES
jgi:hypothetical protein